MANISLLNSPSRVEIPYIKVQIGTYVFGVYSKTSAKEIDEKGFYKAAKLVYPNYVKSLQIVKINGKVNQYTLVLVYPITANDDPNFFEKIFSSVSKSRKIIFSYGDMSMPTYIYKNEEAIITDVRTQFNIASSTITYTVSAVSSAALLSSGVYTFMASPFPVKPSDKIKELLTNSYYGLSEVFYGMKDKAAVERMNLIPGDDKAVKLETKTNISALDYLSYLVSCMIPASAPLYEVKQRDIYILTILDDTSGELGGPYFKISKAISKITRPDAYYIDIGYPTANIVLDFQLQNQENFSIFYDWQKKLNTEEYTYRIDDEGNLELEYAPIISSKNDYYRTRIEDQTWWTKITEYPVSATITLKGLLRPAILMTYVNLNVYFFGWKHISSGTYIVTKQVDRIDESGSVTTLSLTRVAGVDAAESQP